VSKLSDRCGVIFFKPFIGLTLFFWQLTLLATDKTGTLTRNQMTVTNLWSGGLMYSAFQSNNDDATTAPFSLQAPGMAEMVDIAALNSRVKFDKMDVPFDQRQILGDATETGLTRFAGRSLSTGYDQHQKSFPKVFEVPFNSTNKWALVIVSSFIVCWWIDVHLPPCNP
jgi:sodium/potassium-transporting ATPase subunit alpha